MDKSNTKINLLYRDASNYKTALDVVVKGAITRQQIKQIKSNLDDGQFIIAHQVGLPTPSFNFAGKDGWPNDDLDHVWTTLEDFEDDPEPEELHTSDVSTVGMTIEQLANAIANAKWDIAAEMERMAAACKS
jgi:hypothetical protein